MKLAAALSERANLQNRLSELNIRFEQNAKVQEGEKPAEDPKKLLIELAECSARLEYLIAAVNLTNALTVVNGKTITELLARRDALRDRVIRVDDFPQDFAAPHREPAHAGKGVPTPWRPLPVSGSARTEP